MNDDPRYGCGWAFVFAGLLWVVILGGAALIVNALT